MATAWNLAVKTAFKNGRKTNKNYSLKQAMLDAKKIYKKGSSNAMDMGRRQTRRRASPTKGYNRRKYRGGSGMNPLSPSNVAGEAK